MGDSERATDGHSDGTQRMKGAREAELSGLVEHLVEKQRKRSPQEEYDALLALERSGQKLDKAQRQRLASLMMELIQRI